jgi:hypothetical protein
MMFMFAGISVFADVVGIYGISQITYYGIVFYYSDEILLTSLRALIVYIYAAAIVRMLFDSDKLGIEDYVGFILTLCLEGHRGLYRVSTSSVSSIKNTDVVVD